MTMKSLDFKATFLAATMMTCVLTGLTCPQDCMPGQPNPAAVRIDFSIVEQTSDTTGRVMIVGVIENLGSGMYSSSPGQQNVRLLENTTEVASEDFEVMATGDFVMVSYTRDWDTSNEFPPVYRVAITYDPDIFIDGNSENDDCATSDNAFQRDGGEINALFE
jgi:hypothetical protein